MLPPTTPPPPGPAAAPGSSHEELLALRARAEQRRHLVTQPAAPPRPADLQRLVQELQVHQIELEMQNEELLLAHAAAEAAHARYRDLYDFAPVGYFTLSATGHITELNLYASQLLGTGRQRLMQRRFALFVAPAHRLDFGQFLARVLQANHTQSAELLLLHDDGTTFDGQLEGLRVDTPQGPQCRLAVLDISVRQQATARLAASEARFRKLFTESNDAVVLLQGNYYSDCNAAALRLLGAQYQGELVGRPMWAHAPAMQPNGRRTAELLEASVAQALRTGSHRFQVQMQRVAGELIWVEAVLTPIEPGQGLAVVHMAWRDITAVLAARHELERSKEFTESLLDNTIDGILAIDSDWRITAWNAAAAHHFGRPAAEVLGQLLTAVLPTLSSEWQACIAQALAGERIDLLSRISEHRPGRYDAHLLPLRHAGAGGAMGMLAIIRDVTERDRLTEKATRQRLRRQQEVLAAILATQETERKRIAEALHNGLGQLLYATKLSLAGPATRHSVGPESLKLLDDAIRTVRTISFELTPGILEDFGLRIALEELAKRIAPARLPLRLHFTGLEQRLARPVEIAVYRIVQELLNNVMKHARATEIEVHLAHENHRLEVSVEDNGCGFEPGEQAQQPLAGIGLAGVRNRVALLGGELALVSRRGRGTIVSFGLELRAE